MTGAEAALAFRGWDSAADCAPSAEMPRSLWDWDSGRTGPREAEVSQQIVPRETGARGYSGAFPQRAFVEMTMADAEVKAVGFIKRTLPNGSRQGGMARLVRQKPSSAIRFVQWSYHSWPDSPGEAVEHGRVRPAGSVERGKIRSSCMI